MALCIEQTRWFCGGKPSPTSSKIRQDSACARSLTSYIERRKYDYRHTRRKDAKHLDFVTDGVVGTFPGLVEST
jgi:hypothetical protein